jgi:hypothetical protein
MLTVKVPVSRILGWVVEVFMTLGEPDWSLVIVMIVMPEA